LELLAAGVVGVGVGVAPGPWIGRGLERNVPLGERGGRGKVASGLRDEENHGSLAKQ
jgi:hypothetical protein